MQLEVDLRAFPGLSHFTHSVMQSNDLQAINCEAQPECVKPADGQGGRLEGGKLTVTLPPASWNVLRTLPE